MSSADVWEEVHRKTGLPIVTEFYTLLHSYFALAAAGVDRAAKGNLTVSLANR